jgi:hypothetical protein
VREQEVAGEDRDGVVPAGVGAHRPPAHGGLVHHIVVVQRGEMDQFHHGGGAHHIGRPAPLIHPVQPELAGEQGEHRPEALAPGVDQVQRRLGEEAEFSLHLPVQQLLHLCQATLQDSAQLWVGQFHAGDLLGRRPAHHRVRR